MFMPSCLTSQNETDPYQDYGPFDRGIIQFSASLWDCIAQGRLKPLNPQSPNFNP